VSFHCVEGHLVDDFVVLDTVAGLDLLQEFVLSGLLWSSLVADHDDELVLVLCSGAAHVVVAGLVVLTASVAVAEVDLSVGDTLVLILEFLEVTDTSATFWFHFTRVVFKKFEVNFSLFTGFLEHFTVVLECLDNVAHSATDWLVDLGTLWTLALGGDLVVVVLGDCAHGVDWAGLWLAWTLVTHVEAWLGLFGVGTCSLGVTCPGLCSLLAGLRAWAPLGPWAWGVHLAAWDWWWTWLADGLDLCGGLDVVIARVFVHVAHGDVGDLVGGADHVALIHSGDVLALWTFTLWDVVLIQDTCGELLLAVDGSTAGLALSWVGDDDWGGVHTAHSGVVGGVTLNTGACDHSSERWVCLSVRSADLSWGVTTGACAAAAFAVAWE